MKVLSISRNGREILASPVTQDMVIIGRSPTCDIILRAPGVKPVHFLIEWVGTGDDRFRDGIWTLFDLSRGNDLGEKAAFNQGFGEGKILDQEKTEVSGFVFSWREDTLQETTLTGGSLRSSFEEHKSKAQGDAYTTGNKLLEVVSVRNDSDSITDITHYRLETMRDGCFINDLPTAKVYWYGKGENECAKIQLNNIRDVKIFRQGEEVTIIKDPGKIVEVKKGELVQIQWHLQDLYFRFVPEVIVPTVKMSLLADPFYRLLGLGLLLSAILIFIVMKGNFNIPEERTKEPPRIARVEFKEIVQPTPVPTPTPPPPPPEPKFEEPKTVELQKPQKENIADQAVKPTFTSAKPKNTPKDGLNSPAPHNETNTIGLLGALNKQTSTGPKIKADMIINDGIVSQTVSGTNAKFTLQQAPKGTLDKQKAYKASDLVAASTTLAAGDVYDPKATGPIASNNGGQGFHVGIGEIKTKDSGSLKNEADNGEMVEGGLDKESIRRTLATYRLKIRTCYDRTLQVNANIQGRISYKWNIDYTGKVTSIKLAKSDTGSANLEGCVMEVIRGITFPRAANKQSTIVIYPFVFQSKGQ